MIYSRKNRGIFLSILFYFILFFYIDRVLPLPSIKLIEGGKVKQTKYLNNNNNNNNNNDNNDNNNNNNNNDNNRIENENLSLSKMTKKDISKSFKNFKKYLKKFKNEVSFDFENSREKNQRKVTELEDENSDDSLIEDEVEKEEKEDEKVVEEEGEEEGECSVTATPAQQLLLDILKRYQIILFDHLIYSIHYFILFCMYHSSYLPSAFFF